VRCPQRCARSLMSLKCMSARARTCMRAYMWACVRAFVRFGIYLYMCVRARARA
jgi:hypothetical protein